MKTLTNSSLTTFKVCPRKYQFKYIDGYIQVQEKQNLYFGKLFHKALEVWSVMGLDKAIEEIENYVKKSDEPDEYLKVMAIALLEGYDKRYINDNYKTVASEVNFRAPLLNPDTMAESKTFVLGGVIDRIVQKNDSRFFILETKTTSEDISPESNYWRKLQMDSQVSQYYVGAEALGYNIESCLYDVIKKPTSRPYKATPQENRKYKNDGTLYANQREKDETPLQYYCRIVGDITANPDNYYARKEVPREQSDLSDFYFDAWNTAQMIMSCEKKNKFQRFTHSCNSFYGNCAFWEVCTKQASIKDTNYYKKVDEVHQELKVEVKI